ncbi:MAG: hypothetical protein A2365_03080 [Candidatus Nealsonbacteria bacterium RIFOXYB1_FULL_40_15]|uniref:DUF485 domain-containing protein n=2 Tax=Candidatus Nealsoniibacteriota TaxID=1817911 RepID=A0A1G2EV24_9BACT|nr:MAG: hypothetical protein A2365_03080 [Candidatus Nealsonbacteria bacterium RIFOXYB1_FULL_40_15]OGZ29210.1 MAG: hypothetical protein A2427_02935 [Candidatus Nealsonbacteria bacterium RIFOXYC1_FULL_40_7]OGZ29893.1 MAG: hypothetical protein A2562_02115 [Candidatus Nealsonbacteria bacterium RIFOXYD1_FULL_39_11]
MLHPIKLANAATVVFVAYFIVLLIIASIIPDLAVMTPGGFVSEEINWGYLILGLVISSVIVWILVYATVSLYNKML